MKAVYLQDHGGIEKLLVGDVPEPIVGRGEALVRVKACALNHLDVWVRMGIPGLDIPLPHIMGSDAAGVVEKVGPDVRNWTPGQRVLVAPGLSCANCASCRAGDDHLCEQYDILGQKSAGVFSELIKVPATNLVPIPAQFSFEQAASIPLVFTAAWHMLVTLDKVRNDEWVLVHAGGSGVGIAAIQVAKLHGAKVIATVGTPEKAAKAKALGAVETILYQEKDFLEETRRITGGKGVDAVVEHIGVSSFSKSLACLTVGGRMLVCGATSGREVSFDLRALFARNITIFGVRMGKRIGLVQVVTNMASSKLKPVVDKVFPIEEVAAATRHMEERKNFGKIVLTV